MRIGSLRHKIDIIENNILYDDIGGQEDNWINFKTGIYASVEPLRVSEKLRSMALETDLSHLVRTRYIKGVNTNMKIKFGKRIFDINGIINVDEKNIELNFLVKEEIR